MNSAEEKFPPVPIDSGAASSSPKTLEYSSPRALSPRRSKLKWGWVATIYFWFGGFVAAMFIFTMNVYPAHAFNDDQMILLIVTVGRSAMLSSVAAGFFSIAITLEVFSRQRAPVRHPFVVAFILGCVMSGATMAFGRFIGGSSIGLIGILAAAASCTIYPMFAAIWIGHRMV